MICWVPARNTSPLTTSPVKSIPLSTADTSPPAHGYWIEPVDPASTGKSTQLGDDGVDPVTSKPGWQSPMSQSASMVPLQLSSKPLHTSRSSSPVVQPPHVMMSSLHRSESKPSHAAPRLKPLS